MKNWDVRRRKNYNSVSDKKNLTSSHMSYILCNNVIIPSDKTGATCEETKI